MKTCKQCHTISADTCDFCPECGAVFERKVDLILWLGILMFPILFAWFTLGKGYSKLTRSIAFGWLVVALWAIYSKDDLVAFFI